MQKMCFDLRNEKVILLHHLHPLFFVLRSNGLPKHPSIEAISVHTQISSSALTGRSRAPGRQLTCQRRLKWSAAHAARGLKSKGYAIPTRRRPRQAISNSQACAVRAGPCFRIDDSLPMADGSMLSPQGRVALHSPRSRLRFLPSWMKSNCWELNSSICP